MSVQRSIGGGPARARRLCCLGAALLAWVAGGCADEDLMQAAIEAADARRVEAQAKRREREARWPSYAGLLFGLTFERDTLAPSPRWLVEMEEPEFVPDAPFGRAVRFGGPMTLNIDDVPIPAAGTWACWVRPRVRPPEQMRILDGNGYMLALRGGTVVAGFNDGRARVLQDPAEVPLGEWTHLALAWGDSELALYVDGTRRSVVEYSGQPRFPSRRLWIGERWSRNQYRFDGDLDEILVYDRKLGEDEILRLKEEGLFGGDPPTEDVPDIH